MSGFLSPLTHKKYLTILGINSGTSADGLDFALVRVEFSHSKSIPRAIYLGGHSVAFSPSLRKRILAVADHRDPSLSSVLALDAELGICIGRTAVQVMRRMEKQGYTIDAICSHGQTVRHLPNKLLTPVKKLSATCQLGSLERIAEATQKVVIGDVRQGDIATNGEGAPITVAAIRILFGSERESRLLVNIGGISNFFWLPAGKGWDGIAAADCGPGNILIDQLAMRFFQKPYDRNGKLARRGTISPKLLKWAISRTCGSSRSTGREAFGPQFVEQFVAAGRALSLSAYDLLATATELTAAVIVPYVLKFAVRSRYPLRLSLTGGGAKNSFLVDRIATGCASSAGRKSGRASMCITVTTIDELGIQSQMVESATYGIMGAAVLAGYPLPSRWDANGRVAAIGFPGKIVQPSRRIATRSHSLE